MARRMAAMQAMMNSMTPEQRAQLQQLSDQLLDDMDLRWQVDQLGENLRQAFPDMGWESNYQFQGADPMDFAQAAQMMGELGDLDQLEQLMRGATNPGALVEADIERARELLGDDVANSLDRMSEITKMLTDAGLVEQREGRFELTPKGMRRLGQNALAELFKKLDRDRMGVHELERTGFGHERNYHTKPYEFGDPFNLHIERTIRNAIVRGETEPDPPLARRLRDRGDRTRRPVIDGADARPVAVDADARQLPAGEEGRHGAALADLDAVPPRLPRHRRVLRGGPRAHRVPASRGQLGLRVRHEHAARLPARPPAPVEAVGHEADHHDHRRRADRPHQLLRRAGVPLPAHPRDGGRDAHRGGRAAPRTGSGSTRSCSIPTAASRASSRSSRS